MRQLAGSLEVLAAAAIPDDPVALGDLHQGLLGSSPRWDGERLQLLPDPDARKAAGAFYTPTPVVEHLLDLALEPVLDEAESADPARAVGRLLALRVCDPACGSGLFLLGAARRIAERVARRRAGGDPSEEGLRRARAEVVPRALHGVDLDPAAVELARVCLWLDLVAPGLPAPRPRLRLRIGDSLLSAPGHGYDAVVGNPPFLNRLERRTAGHRSLTRAQRASSGRAVGPYTDTSAVFLHRAPDWVRPGGRVVLVQPTSLLAARDTAGIRAELADRCALEALWTCDQPVFDASVLTCAPVLRVGAQQGEVRRTHGLDGRALPDRAVTDGELRAGWGFLAAAGLGIPEVRLEAGGALGDVATCTADFRDQYYGLRPHVREASAAGGRAAPLVTSGLLEPAGSWWGRRPTRFLKQTWQAPVVDLDGLRSDVALARWAGARRVPKVLLGTQGPVLAAAVDEGGEWLPSVPTVTLAAPPERLWHVLAVLLAPPVVAHAAATYAGAGLSARSVKLSARQVALLPLPGDRRLWDQAAACAELAQRDEPRRREHLLEVGRLMCAAYGVGDPEVLTWWAGRLSPNPAGRR